MKLKAVKGKADVRLTDRDARPPKAEKRGKGLERATEKQVERISELQRVLYADERHAVLVVLQGRDASGKDGTIRKVFTAVNPQGCEVTSFKAPTDTEKRHDFLWRVHARVPKRGMIGIFNRSHYEDVLVPRVHGWITKKVCRRRYDQINEFEQLLAENGTVILKFMLHISHDEQQRRLQERLDDPTKNWKFRVGDLDDRKLWDDYTKAYRQMLVETSTKVARWYVVPADDKDARNWYVASTIANTLASLDLRYPKADPAVLSMTVR
jgi:PPK2 family polyphosphate:nucleotide phosphotransferase